MTARKLTRLTLRLPWPPSVNTFYAVVRGRKILSRAGRQYKLDVLAAVLEQMGKPVPLTSRLSVSAWLNPPDRRTRDISNCVKSMEDALTNAGVWEDDSLIDQWRVYRSSVCKPGYVTVRIREIT